MKKIFLGLILFFVIGFIGGWICKGISISEYIYIRSTYKLPMIDDPKLIRAIINIESEGDHKAVSKKGAYGLMQIRYSVWKKELRQFGIYSYRDLFHPEKNKTAGKYILAKHHEWAKGDLRRALQGYSGGARYYFERVMASYFLGEDK